MDALVQDVSYVMDVLDTHGARALVNANLVFERLETFSATSSEEGTDRVNLVVQSFLVDLGLAPPNDNDADVIVIENPTEMERREEVIEDPRPVAENVDALPVSLSPVTLTDETIAAKNGGSDGLPISFSPVTLTDETNDTSHEPIAANNGGPLAEACDRYHSLVDCQLSPGLCQAFEEPYSPLPDIPSNVPPEPVDTKMKAAEIQTEILKAPSKPVGESTSSLLISSSGAVLNTVNSSSHTSNRLSPVVDFTPDEVAHQWQSTGAIPKSILNFEKGLDKSQNANNGDAGEVECLTSKTNSDLPGMEPVFSCSASSSKSSPPKRYFNGPCNEKKRMRPSHLHLEEMSIPLLHNASEPVASKKKSSVVAAHVATLSEMFPEADPQYLWEQCENLKDEEALNILISDMLMSNDYPRVVAVKKTGRKVSSAAGSERDLSQALSVHSPKKAKFSESTTLKADVSTPALSSATTSAASVLASFPPATASSSQTEKKKAVQELSQKELKKIAINYSDCAAAAIGREPWQDQLDFLIQILPEADPSFLEEKARDLFGKEDELRQFVAEAMESKSFPSRKDWQWRQEQLALQKKYTEEFSIPNFLEIIPDPFTYFADPQRKTSINSQASMFLRNKYRKLKVADISSTYSSNNYNLTLTCRALSNWSGATLKSRRGQVDYDIARNDNGKGINVPFLQELAFIENEEKIVAYLEEKKKRREQSFQEAKAKGELLQCQCCFDDEVLFEDVHTCCEGHIFCITCLQKSSEQRIGDGHSSFPCLADCSSEFSLQTLQGVLKPTVFSRLVQRKQAEEIKAAGIEDLVQCPFCDFCNIPPKDDKVFRCLNPDCMKESCRLCQDESHVPLRCDEVEKKSEVEIRTYIENKMTEALVRTCWQCQKKFVKEDGCNKMTCQCGAMMCYICRQPVRDYKHFNGQGGDAIEKCPLYSDHHALEVEEVKKVAQLAKQEVLARKPNLVLKHDPTKLLPVHQPLPQPLDYYSDNSEDWDVSDEEFVQNPVFDLDFEEEEDIFADFDESFGNDSNASSEDDTRGSNTCTDNSDDDNHSPDHSDDEEGVRNISESSVSSSSSVSDSSNSSSSSNDLSSSDTSY